VPVVEIQTLDGRVGTGNVEELAEVLDLLLGDEALCVTGQGINVDGGMEMD
jgi:hypothetical protein